MHRCIERLTDVQEQRLHETTKLFACSDPQRGHTRKWHFLKTRHLTVKCDCRSKSRASQQRPFSDESLYRASEGCSGPAVARNGERSTLFHHLRLIMYEQLLSTSQVCSEIDSYQNTLLQLHGLFGINEAVDNVIFSLRKNQKSAQSCVFALSCPHWLRCSWLFLC